jgi:tryptophan synthase beta chain
MDLVVFDDRGAVRHDSCACPVSGRRVAALLGMASHTPAAGSAATIPVQRDAGHYGDYGGQFVPEIMMRPLQDLEDAHAAAMRSDDFAAELDRLLRDFAGRPTPLTLLRRLGTEHEVTLWLKREDLAHTGAHKINNCIGQGLLARRLGRKRVVAETGAGQHGVATAAVCAHLGLQCTVYMGSVDARRQAPNLARMRLLGAEVRLVDSGTGTLKDATNECMADWLSDPLNTHPLVGSVVGPHPFPSIVRGFQSVIGTEARQQFLEHTGRLPSAVVACVGGGSNAIGIFSAFLDDPVRLVGAEPAGDGRGPEGRHAAALTWGEPGVVHGARTYMLQDDDGQLRDSHSIAPGLNYPGVGPEHSQLKDTGRVEYVGVTDAEALEAFRLLSECEGILPALESSHAVAAAQRLARDLEPGSQILVNLSGRGDKDLSTVIAAGDAQEVDDVAA